MKDYFFLSFFFCLYWISFLFKIDKIKKFMRHNLKLWSMGQKKIMHKLDLVKEWVMKSLQFWIKNLPQISHILYYYTVAYIIFELNSNTFLMNTKRVYSLLPELARNVSIEYGASLGMVIILTSIFERVLVYFLKIEFFLMSNLE